MIYCDHVSRAGGSVWEQGHEYYLNCLVHADNRTAAIMGPPVSNFQREFHICFARSQYRREAGQFSFLIFGIGNLNMFQFEGATCRQYAQRVIVRYSIRKVHPNGQSVCILQGCHATRKTGDLEVHFSRRENTGNLPKTFTINMGKI